MGSGMETGYPLDSGAPCPLPETAIVRPPLRQLTVSLFREHWLLWLIVFAAFLTRFWRLWEPDQVVFDELHFGSFASRYFTGEYFFDIHPPLGKMLIALAAWIGGFEPGFAFENIGDPYGDAVYLPMRAVSALFGALMVPVTYVLVRQMGGGRPAAYLAAAVILLDGALLVESRFILIDSMLLFSGLLSLSVFLAMRGKPLGSWRWLGLLALTGMALGATISVKWTGLGIFGLVGLAALADVVLGLPGWRKLIFRLVAYGLFLLLLPGIIYFYLWVLHFELVPKSGPGDAFMTPEFRSSLAGASHQGDRELSNAEKVWELNRTMYTANSGIRADHPWQSPWWSWPFRPRGLSFWQETVDDTTSRIYLLGMPYVWWLVILGVLVFLYMMARRLWNWRRMQDDDRRLLLVGALLVAGILANWLPFSPIERPVFVYHYFISFILSVLMASLAFDRVLACVGSSRRARIVSATGIALMVLGFLLFSPLAYGYGLPSGLSGLIV